MNIALYISGKKVSFYSNLGWYGGNDFYLFKFNLFGKMENQNSINVFDLQILKFSVLLGFEWQ
jgi:hypothetical protein